MIEAEITLTCARCYKELHLDWLEVAQGFELSNGPYFARNPQKRLENMANYAAGFNSRHKWRIQVSAVPPGFPPKVADFCSLNCQRLAIRGAEILEGPARRKRNA